LYAENRFFPFQEMLMIPLLIVLLIFAAVIVMILLIRLTHTRSELTRRIESFQTELNERLQLELESWRTRELDSLRAPGPH
jgi:predicted Holliday junction resolvase-like endonuclease